MKKTLFIFIFLSCCIFNATAITPLQQKAKNEIFNALKKYGTNITERGDEILMFKYNGTTFEASVHSLSPQTLYLCLSVVFGLPESFDSGIANIAAFNAASNKPVCSFASEGALQFSCEMYAKDAKPFIAVLPEMIQALDSSADNFTQEYENLATTYVPHTQSGNISSTYLSDDEFIYPKVSSRDDSKLYIEKVTLGANSTVLDMVSYNGALYQWCDISRNSYLMANGKKYNLTKADGIAYSPLHTDYPNYESGHEVSLHFKLYFPPLPKGTTSFDFSEGTSSGWNLSGVELKHGNAYSIQGQQIDTAFHKWVCNVLETQDGQTILTKTVTPKENGTYIYSSQDEFIEDAETGRKYYLVSSSIGFEGSPQLSYDTKPITFYEVYPALPSNVKRINISSGSQYYVRDLKIR